MGKRLRKLKKIRLHHEGTSTLILGFIVYAILNALVYYWAGSCCPMVSYVFFGITTIIYLVVVNFFRCPIRHYEEPDTEGLIIAPADGKIVVIEEVEENEYFHDRRLMVSIFMSLFNVHANWVPCDGKVKLVRHHDGRFKAAWLPKASTENERSTVVIESSTGQEILVRQVAGAMARRIVTYLQEGEECEIDEHMGFIKFGSRVDIYLPIGTKVNVELGQRTTGNETIIARLS
ncbi:MAG: phosphatidylserine decarboxylase family protein [Bacteroidaceae bacterium]|jgi:phosphatidylserine decarboxylase|nr:phosphatidylserine decarboxylase family protein [Bacteroidaceae bacterium]MEE0985794.1 phosphatidylserine decarboxylase family protein [Bacteroidaceae bacterium]